MKIIQKGFTLIELMIVVAIIAILAAIAIPAYQDYLIRAQVSEAALLADGGKVAVAEYFANHGSWPTDNTAAGMAGPAEIKGKYTTQVAIAAGVISATMGGDANAFVRGETFVLTPTDNSGSTSWSCTASTITAKYLPSTCRP